MLVSACIHTGFEHYGVVEVSNINATNGL